MLIGKRNFNKKNLLNKNDLQDNSITINNLQSQVSNNDTDITNLQTQINQNDTDIMNLQTQINQNDTDITNLQTQINQNDTDITNLDNKTTDIYNINNNFTQIGSQKDLNNEFQYPTVGVMNEIQENTTPTHIEYLIENNSALNGIYKLDISTIDSSATINFLKGGFITPDKQYYDSNGNYIGSTQIQGFSGEYITYELPFYIVPEKISLYNATGVFNLQDFALIGYNERKNIYNTLLQETNIGGGQQTFDLDTQQDNEYNIFYFVYLRGNRNQMRLYNLFIKTYQHTKLNIESIAVFQNDIIMSNINIKKEITNLQTQILNNDTDIVSIQNDINTNTTDIANLDNKTQNFDGNGKHVGELTILSNDSNRSMSINVPQNGSNTDPFVFQTFNAFDFVVDGNVLLSLNSNGSVHIPINNLTAPRLESFDLRITQNETDINTNQSDIVSLQNDINTNTTDIVSLQNDINTNTTDILTLQNKTQNFGINGNIISDMYFTNSNNRSLAIKVSTSELNQNAPFEISTNNSINFVIDGNEVLTLGSNYYITIHKDRFYFNGNEYRAQNITYATGGLTTQPVYVNVLGVNVLSSFNIVAETVTKTFLVKV